MKSLISIIMALSVFFSTMPVFAEENTPKLLYTAFFSDLEEGDKVPYTLKTKGNDDNNHIQIKDGYLNMISRKEGSPSLEFRTGKKTKSMTVHMRLRFNEYNSDTALWMSDYDDLTARLILFTSLGGIKASCGSSMQQTGTFEKGKWFDVDIAVDANKYSLYIDGKKAVENMNLPLKTNENTSIVWEKNIQSFKIDTYNRTGKNTSMDIADIAIYSGTEIVSVDILKKAAEPVEPEITEEEQEDGTVIYANNNFNELEAGAVNIGIGGDKKTNLVYIDEFPDEDNKSAKLESLTSDTFNVLTSFDSAMKSQFIWDFKVCFDDLDSKATLTLRDPKPLFIDAVSFLTGGQVRNTGNETIATYSANTWYRLQLAVDVAAKTYSFYMDGKKLIDNAALDSSLSSIGLIRFHIYPPSGGGSSIHIDDWRVYEGNEFLTDEYLIKKGSVAGGSHYTDHGKMKSIFNNKYVFAPDAPYYYTQNERVMYNSEDRSIKAEKTDTSLMVPFRSFIENEGGTVEWNNGVTTAVYNGTQITVNSDGAYTLDGNSEHDAVRAQMYGDRLYMPVELIANLTGNTVTPAYMDMCILEKDDKKIDSSKWSKYISEMYRYLLYDHPSEQDIMERLRERYPENEHPRIMVEPDTFDKIKSGIETDENMKKWYKSMIKSADSMLNAAPIQYTPAKGDTLLESARTMLSRAKTLGLSYQLTKDKKYKDALWDNLETVCNFPDWYPTHFLDVGEMSMAVAIAYDWLYNDWSKEERKFLENALEKKGIEVTLQQYETDNQAGYWTVTDNNWNVVCNGGAAVAALAIGDKNPELTGKTVYYALWGLESMMKEFAPDGGWNEGITYWQYTMSYFTQLMSALNTALGDDFGFVEAPGVAYTGMFPIYGTGPKGIFNYHDAGVTNYSSADTLWMSSRMKLPELTVNNLYHREIYGMSGGAQELIWYDPEMNDGSQNTLKSDTVYYGAGLAFMRSSFEDLNGTFVGFHGGRNNVNHGNLDNGTFVLDSIGERWFLDLGADSYSLPEFFGAKRHNYYRNRAEGQNTLVINPDSGPDQIVSATGVITEQFSKPRGAYTILDMTPVYKDVNSVKRGMLLSDDRSVVTVRDELDLQSNSELYWFAHTKADIDISDDGKSAMLTIGNKQLYAELKSDMDAKFSVMDALPLSTSPQHSGQNKNSGVRKLTIHMNGVKKGYIQVSFIPVLIYGSEPNKELIPEAMSFDEWKDYIPDGEIEPFGVDSITLNGKEIEDFDMTNLAYKFKYPFGTTDIPVIEARSDKYEVSVEQAKTMPGTAKISVTDKNDARRKMSYLIEFTVLPQIGNKPEGSRETIPVSVYASDVPQEENIPENTLDGDLSTRWSAFGVQWIEYDLGAEYDITNVEVAWMNGSRRVYPFEIYVSSDKENYENILRTESSATTDDMEIHQLPQTKARYVRVKCFGNNENEWNSLTEIKIYAKE